MLIFLGILVLQLGKISIVFLPHQQSRKVKGSVRSARLNDACLTVVPISVMLVFELWTCSGKEVNFSRL